MNLSLAHSPSKEFPAAAKKPCLPFRVRPGSQCVPRQGTQAARHAKHQHRVEKLSLPPPDVCPASQGNGTPAGYWQHQVSESAESQCKRKRCHTHGEAQVWETCFDGRGKPSFSSQRSSGALAMFTGQKPPDTAFCISELTTDCGWHLPLAEQGRFGTVAEAPRQDNRSSRVRVD